VPITFLEGAWALVSYKDRKNWVFAAGTETIKKLFMFMFAGFFSIFD
jgi:hypothetical protein